jgi:NAD(P)-dependent dehydrogenase (short-subunit alcohol dehydrogenase family)
LQKHADLALAVAEGAGLILLGRWPGRGGGVSVNMSSSCGLEGRTGHPHYWAAKAAILGFTKAAAQELIVQGYA